MQGRARPIEDTSQTMAPALRLHNQNRMANPAFHSSGATFLLLSCCDYCVPCTCTLTTPLEVGIKVAILSTHATTHQSLSSDSNFDESDDEMELVTAEIDSIHSATSAPAPVRVNSGAILAPKDKNLAPTPAPDPANRLASTPAKRPPDALPQLKFC